MIISSKKLIFLILILFVFLIGVGVVSAENMDSDTVSISDEIDDEITTVYDDTSYQNQEFSDVGNLGSGNDKTNLSSDGSKSFFDLTNSVGRASGGSTLNLNYDYKYKKYQDRYGVKISKNLIINGNNHILDGSNSSRVFSIEDAVNVTIKNVKFVNANLAIYHYGGNLTLINCHFINNSGVNGGAIYNHSPLTMINCTFTNNNASYGGAIYETSSSSSFNLNNCTFKNNRATNYGAAIYLTNQGTIPKTITKCVFINNIALDKGIYNNNVNLMIYNSTFDNDSSIYNLGRLYLSNNTIKSKIFGIYNGGKIYSLTNIKILNQNSYVNYGDLIILKAELKDDNNNSINTSYLSFSINGVSHNSYSDDNKYYKYNYTVNTTGSLNISAISGYYLTNVTANTVKYYVLGDECLNLEIHDIKYGETATIISTVNEGATGSIKFNITNNDYNYVEDVNIHDGMAVLNLSNLEIGNYEINAVYSGDTRYDSATIADTFDVLKNDVNLTIQAHDIAIGDKEVIEFITDKNISNINVSIENVDGIIINQNLTIADNKVNITLTNLSLGIYTINVTFEGDEHYNPFNQSQSFEVIKITPNMVVSIKNNTFGQILNISAKLDEKCTGNVTFLIKNSTNDVVYSSVVVLLNSIANINIPNLDAGNYTLELIFNSTNNNYDDSSIIKYFEIDPIIKNLKMASILRIDYESSPRSIKFSLEDDLVKYLVVHGSGFSSKIYSNYVTFTPQSVGTFHLSLRFENTTNYKAVNNTVSIVVSMKATGILITEEHGYVGQNLTVNATLSSYNTYGKLNVTIKKDNNVVYSFSSYDSKVSINYIPTQNGTYWIEVKYANLDGNYKNSTATKSVVIEKKAIYDGDVHKNTLIKKELVSREYVGYNWYVKKGVLYGKTTYYDEYKETLNHTIYNKYGDITYTELYSNTYGEDTYKIVKYGTIKPKLNAKKVKYGNSVSIFSGVKHFRNLKAKIKYQYDKKHYKTITVKTGFNGCWEIPTSKFKTLGKHKIIVSAYGKKLIKTIYIKKGKYRISASGATVKKGKSKYIEIEVMDNSYNSIKNKKVTVKVLGKTYKLKTNKWGIAKFNTKKLSLGNHKVKISVAGNKFYKSSSKKITIKVKKYIPRKTVYELYADGYYLSGYHEKYNYDNDMEFQAWLGSEWGNYGQISVEVSGRDDVKMDSVVLVFKSKGKYYTKKLSIYDNYCGYIYIPRTATYVKTTIKWHYK